MTVNDTSGQGKRNELLLLLDLNNDLSVHTFPYDDKNATFSKKTLNFDFDPDIQEVSAKIHINTLSPYVGFGGGNYLMSDVKRMTTKDDFLDMELKDRNCEVELYEDCRTRRLFEHCSCIPWELADFQV